MRLAFTVGLFGTLSTVACQQIWDIVSIKCTFRCSSLYSCPDFTLAKVANDVGQAETPHVLPTHSRPDKFCDAWCDRERGYCH